MSKKKKITIAVVASVTAVIAAVGVTLGVLFSSDGPFKGTVKDVESGEPLAGVMVTDGRNVVKTDENGEFKLDGYHKSRFITVTTPSGYTTSKYWLSVDKNTESYDFELKKTNVSTNAHNFLQVSDTEIGAGGAGEWVDHIKKVADEQKSAFLIHTGDICYEDGLKTHLGEMNTENMGLPVYYIMGNHDYVDGKYGEELFESIYGPAWYSFDVGNVHYVVTPIQYGDYASGYSRNDRWRWLENDLKNTDPEKKVVIFNHNNPVSDDYVISFDMKKLDLKEYNLAAWIFGHYHYNYIEENNGVLNISTARPDAGGIDSSVSGTRMISVDENDNFTSKLFYYDMPDEISAPQKPIWSTQLNGNVFFTDTLAVDGKIYTATGTDNYPIECGVYCLDEKTGEILWNYPTKNAVKNNIVFADGKIVAQDSDGLVTCLNANSGEKIWEFKTDLQYTLGTSSGICTDGKTVYAGNSADVSAINLADGKELWTYHRGHGENSPAKFVLAGDKLIISPHWDAVAALDKNTGRMLWENKDEDIRFRSSTPVAIDDKTILVADSDAVMILDVETGEIVSKTDLEGYGFAVGGQPVIDGEKAYIPTVGSGVVAFDLTTKKILWEAVPEIGMAFTSPYSSKCATVEGTPVLIDGQLIFGASDGNVYVVSTSDGSVSSKYVVGAPIFGKAVYCEDNSVIVGDFAGRVTKISLK